MKAFVKEYPALGERIWEAVLPNRLRVRVVPKPGFAKTYAFLATDYGSIDTAFVSEGSALTTPDGVAHYLEHKMFDLPQGNTMQMFSEFGGNPNAFTSYDITAYYVECTDHVRENLELLLDMVFTPYFTEESVEKERGIIGQEIRMYEDSADSRVYENLFSSMYRYHPVKTNIAGTVESIGKITAETLYACHSAFYTPENMMLCVVGDVEPEMVFQAAERVPAGKRAATNRNYGQHEDMTTHRSYVEQTMEVSMPGFAIGFKAEPKMEGMNQLQQDLLGDLAAELLVGESSPLFSRLYRDGLIDSDFSCGYESVKGACLLSAGGDSKNPSAVLEAMLREAERIGKEGVDPVLFERLKRSAVGRAIRGLDSFESICYRMCAYHFAGVEYFEFVDAFKSVTMENTVRFLTRTVQKERSALSVILPEKKGGNGNA